MAPRHLLLPIIAVIILLTIWRWRKRKSGDGKQASNLFRLYRRKMLISITIIVVLGQLLYAWLNVLSFQHSYLASIQSQSLRLGEYLRQDIEYVLKLGIPLKKLIKIETSLAEMLNATPEILFIEVTDLDDKVIYYTDQQTMEKVTDERLSATITSNQSTDGLLGISPRELDLRIPVTDGKSDSEVGFIQMRISAQMIWQTSREIIWDILTVILVSMLITFEFLGFFVNRSFSDPLRRLIRQTRDALVSGHSIRSEERLTMPGITRLVGQTNYWLRKIRDRDSGCSMDQEKRQRIETLVHDQLARVDQMAARHAASSRHALIQQIAEPLRRMQQRMRPESEATAPAKHIPYHYIRPFVFLFFIAYNLPVSFFPMFVDSFAQPAWDLPSEMYIGLPISIFMFFFALSMLLSGRWLDRAGWYRPLLIGSGVFAAGFVLTALATSYLEMVIYRSISAIGLGIGFMAFQQFVVTNTYSRERNIGMASFLGAFFAGEIVGTVIGGMLADRLGYTNIFMLSGFVALLSLLGIVMFLRNSQKKKVANLEHPHMGLGKVLGALRDREFLAIVIFQAIPAKIALVGFLMYFVPLYLAHLQTLQSDIGRIAMSYGLMLVLVGPLISRWLAQPAMRKYHVFTGGIITGGAMIGFAFASDVMMVLIMVAALGVAHAFSLSSQASLIAETNLVRRVGLGAGMGIYRFWERVGNVTGPFLMAALIAWQGYEEAIVTLGTIIIISSMIYIVLMMGVNQRSEQNIPAQGAEAMS